MANETLTYQTAETPALPRGRPLAGIVRRLWRKPEGQAVNTVANVHVATYAMLIAFAVFAMFGSEGMRHAARDLAGNAASDVLVDATDSWHAAMLALGPAHARDAVRDVLDKFRMAQWPWR